MKYSTGAVPTNAAGKSVYRVIVLDLASLAAPVTIEGLENYGIRDISPIEGKVYLYLPNGEYAFTVDGVGYAAPVASTPTV